MRARGIVIREHLGVVLGVAMLLTAVACAAFGVVEWVAGISAAYVATIIMWGIAQMIGQGRLRRSVWHLVLVIPCMILAYAFLYLQVGLVEDGKVTHNFGTAVYFSVVTWTTLGYGDLQPTPDGRVIAAAEALLGYIMMGILVGTVVTLGMGSRFSGKKPERIIRGTTRGTKSGSRASRA